MKYCYSLEDSRLKNMFELDITWIDYCGNHKNSISSIHIDGIKQMCKELFGDSGYLIYLEEYKSKKDPNSYFSPNICVMVSDCSAHNCPDRDTMYCDAGAIYKSMKVFFDDEETAMAFKLRWE